RGTWQVGRPYHPLGAGGNDGAADGDGTGGGGFAHQCCPSVRKLESNWRPSGVPTDSGWNCTPHTGWTRCSSAINTPSSLYAVARSSSGSAPSRTQREW